MKNLKTLISCSVILLSISPLCQAGLASGGASAVRREAPSTPERPPANRPSGPVASSRQNFAADARRVGQTHQARSQSLSTDAENARLSGNHDQANELTTQSQTEANHAQTLNNAADAFERTGGRATTIRTNQTPPSYIGTVRRTDGADPSEGSLTVNPSSWNLQSH